MPSYYTEAELSAASGLRTASDASARLNQFSKSLVGPIDVFLSHSVLDARVILGLHSLLSSQGLRVYVDWIDDPHLDRAAVSPATAVRLRKKMSDSRSLIYATSRAASASRWMPWELGYFDGLRNSNRISILPIENPSNNAFVGQEYLGLYRTIEKVLDGGQYAPFAVRHTRTHGEALGSFARGLGQFVQLTQT
ncbi:toll/interleukin-1 receptor domain-containing protein [Rhodococcoides kyotonense]|uniref:TIR domain-containing protein n=1 Tax=Rhodococcoides kyotonense TaxID=398843 RepID=A0A239N651_9NOCA|nr:toll/interleukin-1 receptor domain-containing protein [Rhodococcus kyotonensis]SNT50200.1 TIR domain-containing protein [Rhodococcus kyotonensis]